ncbi:hypothetical protein [Priestia koreensis]|uniref:hypothetical protein n=1 Tax=Priestia koreensis TaxID=284581 RepID=UPI001F5861F4|nr:hypothetical protein [Priestia koreensis]UNL86004.1 hypothetical protein IE339_05725 [Priestia koreensis]
MIGRKKNVHDLVIPFVLSVCFGEESGIKLLSYEVDHFTVWEGLSSFSLFIQIAMSLKPNIRNECEKIQQMIMDEFKAVANYTIREVRIYVKEIL